MALPPAPWRAPLAMLLSALPWLNPLAAGPSPAVVPWLVSMACGVALWLLACTRDECPRLPRGLLWAAPALLAWALLSHLTIRPEIAMLAGGLVLVLLVAGAARVARIAPALQAGLLAAAALNAVAGLVQYFGGADAVAPFVNFASAGVAFGNLRQTNQFATLCWMGVAVVLFGSLRLPRWAATVLVVLLATGSAASASRTGMLEGLALLVLCAWWREPNRRQRLALCMWTATAYVLAVLLLPLLLEWAIGITTNRSLLARLAAPESCSSRRVLWANVLHLVAQQPWVGWGWGELDRAHYLTLYQAPRFCEILDNAHNLPLHLAVELGVPAALAICFGVLAWAWRQRPWGESEPLRQLAWALLALLALHSLLEYPLWYGPFQLALGVCLGWLARTPPQAATRLTASLRGAVAGALVAATGYAAWDYARVSQIYRAPAERWAPWRANALEHARRSWLFSGPARFADVTLADTTPANAQWIYQEARLALHYSPEPRVIERVIESAAMLGRDDEALLHLARYRAAFPREYAAWQRRQRPPPAP